MKLLETVEKQTETFSFLSAQALVILVFLVTDFNMNNTALQRVFSNRNQCVQEKKEDKVASEQSELLSAICFLKPDHQHQSH